MSAPQAQAPPACIETAPLDQLAYQLLAQLGIPLVTQFLAAWPREPARRRTSTSHPAPVLRVLPQLLAAAPDFSSQFIGRLSQLASTLSWQRTYRDREVGQAFLDGYAYCEFIGLTGAVPSENLACGVLLLAPDLNYPPHLHEAEELYIPLAGDSSWQRGAEPWKRRAPGELIHHPRHQPHAMQTFRSPLLAIYLWRSEDLAQKSQLV